MTRRIDIVPANCPPEKEQAQKTLYLAVEKLMDEYLATDDDKTSVGLSILGTLIANKEPKLRQAFYTRLGDMLMMGIEAAENDERRNP